MTAYQESFGNDFFDDEWNETLVRDTISYNGVTHEWECTCRKFQRDRACGHTYRFRRQDTIEVNEDYL